MLTKTDPIYPGFSREACERAKSRRPTRLTALDMYVSDSWQNDVEGKLMALAKDASSGGPARYLAQQWSEMTDKERAGYVASADALSGIGKEAVLEEKGDLLGDGSVEEEVEPMEEVEEEEDEEEEK